jgi:hypothetical protein
MGQTYPVGQVFHIQKEILYHLIWYIMNRNTIYIIIHFIYVYVQI